jgi:enamidase
MADAPKDAPESGRTLIHNIGLLLTGDLNQPISDSDCLLIEDGVIVGLEHGDADRVIDAGGCAVAPWPDRWALPPCFRRLDTTPEPKRLD